MASRRYLVSVNRAIRAAELDESGLDGPMVELLRDLARKMDAAGSDGPSQKLMAMYLSATKDLRRAAARKPAPKTSREEGEGASAVAEPSSPASLHAVEVSALDKLRQDRARRATG